MYISLALHEFGHYIASKVFNLKVRECCVGTGPSILKFSFKETRIYFRLVPIGGYVGTDEEELNKVDLLQYWIIVLAGVLMNYMACLISLYIEAYKGISYSFKVLIVSIRNFLYVTSLNSYHLEGSMKNFIDSVNSTLIGLSIWEILFCVNGALLIVNLIPIPFLDGGQILIITSKRILAMMKNYSWNTIFLKDEK
jgi:Predicted membrane-associated Zn-dependent proteases 1